MSVVLSANGDRAAIDPADGARLTSLVAGGRERLRNRPPEDARDDGTLWGCFLMAPWAGRVAGGRLRWEGREWQLRRNLGEHSIHGVVFDAQWSADEVTAATATLSCPLDPERWPFGGVVRQRFTLVPGALGVAVEVEATERSMPAAAGWHPWFARPEGGDVSVRVDADDVLEMTPDLIPTGGRVPVGGDTDLRAGPRLGHRRLDNVYPDARGPAVISWPDLDLRIDFGPPVTTVVVFTPPGAACVEPQTAWPNAPALASAGVAGTGLIGLTAGDTLRAATTWSWSAR